MAQGQGQTVFDLHAARKGFDLLLLVQGEVGKKPPIKVFIPFIVEALGHLGQGADGLRGVIIEFPEEDADFVLEFGFMDLDVVIAIKQFAPIVVFSGSL